MLLMRSFDRGLEYCWGNVKMPFRGEAFGSALPPGIGTGAR